MFSLNNSTFSNVFFITIFLSNEDIVLISYSVNITGEGQGDCFC